MVAFLFHLLALASAIAIVTCTIMYLFLRKKFSYWKDLGIPGPEPQMVFGNIKELVKMEKTDAELTTAFYKQYNKQDYIGLYSFWHPMLLVRDLGLIKRIMEKDFDHFTDRSSVGKPGVKTDSVMVNLFSLKGSAWKSRRTLFTKLFTPKKLREYMVDIQNCLSYLMKLMDERVDQDLELSELVKRHAIRAMSLQLYGLDVTGDEERIGNLTKSIDVITQPSDSLVLKMICSATAPVLFKIMKVSVLPAFVYEYFADLTNKLVSAREKCNGDRNDLLDMLMKETDGIKNNESMSYQEVVGHMFVFLQASIDTTQLTICHMFLQLALHPEVQEKARQEVDSILNGSEVITYDHISEMNYLEAILCETLRIYPIVGVIDRACTKPYKVDDKLTLPKGMTIQIPVASLHMDPVHYPEPGKFIPERFYNKEGNNKVAWLPFGSGPKTCIGKRLANVSVKLLLAKTLSRYEILLSDKMTLPMKFDPKTIVFSVKPVDGFWIKLKKRA